ncbi:MAG: PASTA domain-containing protein [Elusimicrobiota bacterium]|jgi:beta-lactam-binding protein with PASTA domain|nr:PASTA domain-containing protein [Elusimicrobiota bacterium]
MKKKYLRTIIALIILCAAFYFSFNSVMNALVNSNASKETVVPDICGKTIDEALEILSESGLALIGENTENNNFDKGIISKQFPAAQGKIREGSVIKVIVTPASSAAL